MSKEEQQVFFEKTIPFMVKLVLETPQLFGDKNAIKYSRQYQPVTVELSRRQCACILANSFFCTFDRDSDEKYWGMYKMPSINMDEMFGGNQRNNIDAKIAKIRMILNYFRRIAEKSKQLF